HILHRMQKRMCQLDTGPRQDEAINYRTDRGDMMNRQPQKEAADRFWKEIRVRILRYPMKRRPGKAQHRIKVDTLTKGNVVAVPSHVADLALTPRTAVLY